MLEALLRDADELVAIELIELRDRVLVDGVDKEKSLEAPSRKGEFFTAENDSPVRQ